MYFAGSRFAIIIKTDHTYCPLQAPYKKYLNSEFIMIRITNVKLAFDHPDQALLAEVSKVLATSKDKISEIRILKRSLDARKGKPLLRVYSILVKVSDEKGILSKNKSNPRVSKAPDYHYQAPSIINKSKHNPIVVGTGPAGIFAGLILAEAGLEPILLERGKPVKERAKDTQKFWNEGELDPESNVQFGEGGAGTFSDGKLQTRVKDKLHRDKKILQILVDAGAPREILFENKPHIGTANLIGVVKNLRKYITELGGRYLFETRLDDLDLNGNRITGVQLSNGSELKTDFLILAIGHSARDTYQMLHERGVKISPKPFSVGFRIEHPQELINRNQYGKHSDHPELGAADYQLAYHSSDGRTVYSFCMCPGGSVIAAASEAGHLVTNGMSQYARDGINANSAIVAEVHPSDFEDYPLAGIDFQRYWESEAFNAGGENYFAPAQLVGDFISGIPSSCLGTIQPSYLPGIKLSNLRDLFPPYIIKAILEALPYFDRRISGFSMDDAVLTGIETRTSAPLRIIRDRGHQSVSIQGLFPAGEGSGYAGGIMSSAIDGIKTAESVIERINTR